MAADVICGRCHTPRVYKRIQTTLLGTVPVELGICNCDFPSCQRYGCRKTLRGVPVSATRCPHCNGLLWQETR